MSWPKKQKPAEAPPAEAPPAEAPPAERPKVWNVGAQKWVDAETGE
jgi:hypothetical protein